MTFCMTQSDHSNILPLGIQPKTRTLRGILLNPISDQHLPLGVRPINPTAIYIHFGREYTVDVIVGPTRYNCAGTAKVSRTSNGMLLTHVTLPLQLANLTETMPFYAQPVTVDDGMQNTSLHLVEVTAHRPMDKNKGKLVPL